MATPKKKRAMGMAERMAARNMAQVGMTGDAQMDSVLSKEVDRRTAFQGTAGTTARAAENPIRRAYNAVAGLFKRRSR